MPDQAERALPVIEVFGPTIQGEGPDAGRPCLFVRFGGCDYRCSWCDSLHAVTPALVRANAKRMTPTEIVDALRALAPVATNEQAMTVVLSGGNPALLNLDTLLEHLWIAGYRTSVETQGSRWKDWMWACDLVVVSPKPPSSGMETNWSKLDSIAERLWNTSKARSAGRTQFALKVVVGDDADYRYAAGVHARYPTVPFYISVLNPAGSNEQAFNILTILASYRELCERVACDRHMRDAYVMPQLHTLAWGAAQGV